MGVARGFDQATISTLRAAARLQAAEHLRGVVRPDDHTAAITQLGCISSHLHIGANHRVPGVAHLGIAALVIATDSHLTAASAAGGQQRRLICQGDGLPQHIHSTAAFTLGLQHRAARQLGVASALDHHAARRGSGSTHVHLSVLQLCAGAGEHCSATRHPQMSTVQ